jgi:hypothetical protein
MRLAAALPKRWRRWKTTKEKWCEAEVNRIAGEVALVSPVRDVVKAEAYFERAVAVARQQQANPGNSAPP